jgi:hypothetical protein
MIPLISAVLPLISKLIPDTNARKAAEEELKKLDQSGELQTLLGQLAINKEEAKSENVFVSGWRPFVGWTCGASLAWEFLIKPFLVFFAVAFDLMTKAQVDLVPTLELSVMMPVLLGMLGLGGMRSFEKWKGANKNR